MNIQIIHNLTKQKTILVFFQELKTSLTIIDTIDIRMYLTAIIGLDLIFLAYLRGR